MSESDNDKIKKRNNEDSIQCQDPLRFSTIMPVVQPIQTGECSADNTNLTS